MTSIDYNRNDTISLCMIVKNEEKYLERCLKSVEGVVDEIIIVDTGSTDQTTKISEKFGAKILEYQWNDDFSSARNYSLKNAKCDWILVLDADEELDSQSKDKLREAINYDTGIVNFLYIIEELNALKLQYPQARLFRNHAGIEYNYPVMENIYKSIDKYTQNGKNYRDYPIYINHFSFEDIEGNAERFIRDSGMIDNTLNNSLLPHNDSVYFLLKQIYYYRFLNVEPQRVLELINNVFSLVQQIQYKDLVFEPAILYLNIYIIDYLFQIEKIENAKQIVENALKFYPDSLNLLYRFFRLELAMDNYEEGVKLLIKCQNLIKNNKYHKFEFLALDSLVSVINSYLIEFSHQGYDIEELTKDLENEQREKDAFVSQVVEFNDFFDSEGN